MSAIWLYAGSFDPLTLGHMEIIRRALALTDKLIVATGQHASKTALLSPRERKELIEKSVSDLPEAKDRVEVSLFDGLVVDHARKCGAKAILRSLRNTTDHNYEEGMAQMNKVLNPELETVFLMASPRHAGISSTLVRQIFSMGRDVKPFVPKPVAEHLQAKRS